MHERKAPGLHIEGAVPASTSLAESEKFYAEQFSVRMHVKKDTIKLATYVWCHEENIFRMIWRQHACAQTCRSIHAIAPAS